MDSASVVKQNKVLPNETIVGESGNVFFFFLPFNPRTYKQIHTPTVVQERGGGVVGGWMEPLPGLFDMLQYFETS